MVATTYASLDTLRFGPFVLDPVAQTLCRDGAPVHVEPKAFEALHHLARHPGRLVTREALLTEVWPGVHVSDGSVSQIIRKVRKVLGDRASRPKWVKTEHGKGYRFVGAVTAEAPVTVAPRTTNDFFGRGPLLTALTRALAVAGSLVTLVGPGGIGKTRLTVEYLGRTWEAWQGSAWFVDCTSARTTAELCQVVARGLDVPLTGDARPAEHLARVLSHRDRGLLVVDNLEQVLGAARAVIDTWRHAAPEMTVLATSRTALDLPGEQVLPVGPLSEEAAERLFHARAGTGDEDAEVVRALVARLDRDPLSIELAATRALVMSPVQILERLDQRLSLLGRRGDTTRHGNLRNNLQWSWDLLEGDHKELLSQCAGFLAGFPLDAAEAVAVLSSGAWPGDVAQDLVSSGLLRTRRTGDTVRMRMAEALRLFSAEQSRRRPDIDDVELRRARYLAGVADRLVEERAHGTAEGATLSTWMPDLRVAWRFAMPDHPDLAARLALAMHASWEVDGPYDEAMQCLERTIDAEPSPDLRLRLLRALVGYPLPAGTLLARLDAAEDLANRSGSALRRSQILDARAFLCLRRGQSDEALQLVDRAMALAREANEPEQVGYLLALRANGLRSLGRFDDAAAVAAEGLAMGLSTRTRASLLQVKATADHRAGRLEDALVGMSECAELAGSLGDRRARMMVAAFMAVYGAEQGEPADVDEAFDEALTLARELGDERSEGRMLANLSAHQLFCSRWAEAAGTARRGAMIAERVDDQETRLVATLNLAVAKLMRQDPTAARRVLAGMAAPSGTRFAAWARVWAAVAAAELSLPHEAEAHLEASRPMLAATGDTTAAPCLALTQAILLACRGDPDAARALAATQDGESFHKLDLMREILARNVA